MFGLMDAAANLSLGDSLILILILAYFFGCLFIGVNKGLRPPAPPPLRNVRCRHALGDQVEMRGGKVVQYCRKCGNWIEAVWHG